MQRALILFLTLSVSILAHALCDKPQPRLVCAEYSQSEAVVTARLIHVSHHVPKRDQDYFIYEMKMEKNLRGEVPQQFQIWEENSSGRATFGWKRGKTYLLFLGHQGRDYWELDGCGNSAPVKGSELVLKEIEIIQAGLTKGWIQGKVDGVPGVRVFAVGSGHQYRARTADDGQFRISVVPGQYRVTFEKAHWAFERDPFSYEDPSNIRMQDGGCVQVFIHPKPTRD